MESLSDSFTFSSMDSLSEEDTLSEFEGGSLETSLTDKNNNLLKLNKYIKDELQYDYQLDLINQEFSRYLNNSLFEIKFRKALLDNKNGDNNDLNIFIKDNIYELIEYYSIIIQENINFFEENKKKYIILLCTNFNNYANIGLICIDEDDTFDEKYIEDKLSTFIANPNSSENLFVLKFVSKQYHSIKVESIEQKIIKDKIKLEDYKSLLEIYKIYYK